MGLQDETWGMEHLEYPKTAALIQVRWDLCIGCGMCEMACSMSHHGILNRELSRIKIYRYLTPVPKAVQNVCCNCGARERECEKSCPQAPPAISYNQKEQHMTVDEDRCLGSGCGRCREACPAHVPSYYPPSHDYAMVCDLCYRDGKRRPQCVEICPAYALEFMKPAFPPHMERFHPDEKARLLGKRLYPLTPGSAQRPPREVWKGGGAR